jgi:hypothetical protein
MSFVAYGSGIIFFFFWLGASSRSVGMELQLDLWKVGSFVPFLSRVNLIDLALQGRANITNYQSVLLNH